jgi:hypothetical protein
MQNSGDKAFTTKVKKYYVSFKGSLDKNQVNSRILKINLLKNDTSYKPDGLLRVGEKITFSTFLKPKKKTKNSI